MRTHTSFYLQLCRKLKGDFRGCVVTFFGQSPMCVEGRGSNLPSAMDIVSLSFLRPKINI